VNYVQKAGFSGLKDLGDSERKNSEPAELDNLLGQAVFQLIPAGWFDQNKLSLCRGYERYLLPIVNREQRVVSPDAAGQSQSALEKQRWGPYNLLSRMVLPGLAGVASRSARTQTSLDLARVACALERYRLANGQFPATLEALAPKFIGTLPHDVINGQPLKYRLTDDGQFVLYSVGWNQTDDGGKVELTKNGYLDMHRGDWVWRYPAR
jgi:hypothetical protein